MNKNCPSRKIFLQATGRWGSLVLCALIDGRLRFGEIKRKVEPISDKMLSKTLSELADDGLVERTSWEGNPPRVEYCLTEIGMEVALAVQNLIRAVEKVVPEVLRVQNEQHVA